MEEKKTCPCCEERHKERSDKEYKDLIHRLNRMEGQIRGYFSPGGSGQCSIE